MALSSEITKKTRRSSQSLTKQNNNTHISKPSPGDTLSQISFAPATQTTVVTTTTTTTTNFPPLIVKAPRERASLDPKVYPLAETPTPQSIKRMCFEMDGKPTYFREAEDPVRTFRKVCFLSTVLPYAQTFG